MKYLRIYLASLQVQLQYRVNLLGWIFVNCTETIVFIWIWLAILGSKDSLQSYAKGDFIIYFLFMSFLWYIVGGNFYNAIGDSIKSGEINKNLLKPYNVLIEKFLNEQGWKTVSLIIVTPIYIAILFYFRNIISFHLSFFEIILLLVSLFLGMIIFALIDTMVGLSGFWITEVWSAATFLEVCMEVFGGRLAPLTLMPTWIQTIANFLPFKYMFFVPTQILTHKSTQPIIDISIQVLFVLILFLMYKGLWYLGLKKYESIGG